MVETLSKKLRHCFFSSLRVVMANLLFGTRRGMAVEHARLVLIANEPITALSAIWLKKILGLGIVQSSRSSPRRADAREKRPARRIAGGEALFQGFVDLVFGRRSSRRLRLALAPPTPGAMPVLGNGPGHHVTGGIPGVAADATGARGSRAVVVLMIHLLPAPARGLRTPSRPSRWPQLTTLRSPAL